MVTTAVLHHNTPILTARGLFHELDLYPDHLVIRRTDLFTSLFGTEEVIAYHDITAVHIVQPRFLRDNWLRLVIMGKDGRSHALSYGAGQQDLAYKVRQTIEGLLTHSD